MKIYNALQLKAGAKVRYNKLGTITQPYQFLPMDEKDEEWAAWNMDWLEVQGVKQIKRNARRLLKNYKLAIGIIDKSDYIVADDNESREILEVLTKEDESAFELKFYPIIPNVINVLTGEFAKRKDKIMYRAVDDDSYNEFLEAKRQEVEQVLLTQAETKIREQWANMGFEPSEEEEAQALAPENLKTLPEIEGFYKKDYLSLEEQWASSQHIVDEERFRMDELEQYAFFDSLVTDREFWHFSMGENDYKIEVLNPVTTFYHKSPNVRYISEGYFAGFVELMTAADVIDKYGYKMTAEQLSSLEDIYPAVASGYAIEGVQNDGSFYDPTHSHRWNVEAPSLGFRQFTAMRDQFGLGADPIEQILGESEDLLDFGNQYLIRVTTGYWKSQRKVGYLTHIDAEGGMYKSIVDENYIVTEKPIYDKTISKEKSEDNLIYGEHIEWIWINQTWGGIKIGPNHPAFPGHGDSPLGIEPIYLDVKPIKFQFKGDDNVYGCKLPIEGAVFSDRNTASRSLVDAMKPFQIGYNIVNNQIADILVDELGTVIVLDQNSLPKHSMGEDWGTDSFAKAYVAMKDFSILPLDTTIKNTESAINFQHYQSLDLEQSKRLMSRVQLAAYFKQEAFSAIGITPQRLGNINAQETATGVENAINNSYSQTEKYFMQHSEHVMPRVHEMRTDLAAYYHSNNPSVRLSYMTSNEEKVNFQINGTRLLMKDINVYVTTSVYHRQILDQMKRLALENNTSGASLFDLASMMMSDSVSEMKDALKYMEKKALEQQQAERDQLMQIEQERLAAQAEELRKDREAEVLAQDKEIQKDITVAKIRASFAQNGDANGNSQSDFLDAIERFDKQQNDKEKLLNEREKTLRQEAIERERIALEREALNVKRQESRDKVTVAVKNKNKYDAPSKKKK